jgi:hypothetical protein
LFQSERKALQLAAHARLEEMDVQMAGIHRRNIRIHVLALVYRKHGQEPKALETLDIVLAMAEPGGWVGNFVDLGDPMTRPMERFSLVHPENVHATTQSRHSR